MAPLEPAQLDDPSADDPARPADDGAGQRTYIRMLEEVVDTLLLERGGLTDHPASLACLVRAATAAGAWRRAEHLVAAAERLAADHPDVPSLAVAAAHARGVRDSDPDLLESAAACSTDLWSRGCAEEDAGVLRAERSELQAAVADLAEARDAYGRAGARRDRDRVRSRLRTLGVRDGHGTYSPRPPTGWAGLTDGERRVAELAAEGLTNRQIAERTFLSPHTVAFHLRRVYRKMDVGSRVALTRVLVGPVPAAADENRRRLALVSQAAVEQAKGALAAMGGWTTEESRERLLRISRRSKLPLGDVAVEVLRVAGSSGGPGRPEIAEAVRAELGSARPREHTVTPVERKDPR